MTTINLVATDQLLAVALQPKLASGDLNSVLLHVDFDSEWDGYAKSAVFFTSNDSTVYEAVMTDGECTVPHEVLAEAGVLYIGIRGVNSTTNAVKTSTLVKYRIAEGAPSGSGTTVEPTAGVYQQILTAYNLEHSRLNAMVASQGEGATQVYEFTPDNLGSSATGTITSDGINAVIEIKNAQFLNTGYFEICTIPEQYSPILAPITCLPSSAGNSFTITSALKLGVNVSEMYGGLVDVVKYYPLANPYLPELKDVRVGLDGEEYESAGDAVRTQSSWSNPVYAEYTADWIANEALQIHLLDYLLSLPTGAYHISSQNPEGEGEIYFRHTVRNGVAYREMDLYSYDGYTLTKKIWCDDVLVSDFVLPTKGYVDSLDTGGGLNDTASALLINILRNAVYSTDQSANITALEAALAESGDSGDSGDDTGGGNSGNIQSGSTLTIVSCASATQSGSVLTIL